MVVLSFYFYLFLLKSYILKKSLKSIFVLILIINRPHLIKPPPMIHQDRSGSGDYQVKGEPEPGALGRMSCDHYQEDGESEPKQEGVHPRRGGIEYARE